MMADKSPSIWKKALIHPIPKGKNKTIRPLLFCGLALQSCIYKLYSSILNTRFLRFLEAESLIEDKQNGFHKLRSCSQHIFTLTEILKDRQGDKKLTYLCFVDFCKAFDYLDRDLMLAKLVKLGIKGKLYFAIKALMI